MTNEEKTNEICCKNCAVGTICKQKQKGHCETYMSVLSMAIWKEQQMIEKAVEWLEPIFKDLSGYDCVGDLVEDFKKAMKEE